MASPLVNTLLLQSTRGWRSRLGLPSCGFSERLGTASPQHSTPLRLVTLTGLPAAPWTQFLLPQLSQKSSQSKASHVTSLSKHLERCLLYFRLRTKSSWLSPCQFRPYLPFRAPLPAPCCTGPKLQPNWVTGCLAGGSQPPYCLTFPHAAR